MAQNAGHYDDPPYYTLLSYHLYRQDGALACADCVGVRRTPMCRPPAEGLIRAGQDDWVNGFHVFIPDDPAIIPGQTYLMRFDVEHRNDSVWGSYPGFEWPSQDVPVTIEAPPGGGGKPRVVIDRPPAVVTYSDLVGGNKYGFTWSGANGNGMYTYDLQYRSKQTWQADYPATFDAPSALQDTTAQQFSASIFCDQNARDWQFRLRAHSNGQTGDWVYVESQTRVYPLAWPTYSRISALLLDADPGPWQRPGDLINLGGGTFDWSAADDRDWITTYSSGHGEGPLGIVLSKPGGVGDYQGAITVTLTGWSPSPNCGPVATPIAVSMHIRNEFYTGYLPIIFKGSQ
jgi:hypothetical protein